MYEKLIECLNEIVDDLKKGNFTVKEEIVNKVDQGWLINNNKFHLWLVRKNEY